MNEHNKFDQGNEASNDTYTSPLSERLKQDEERRKREKEKKSMGNSKAGYFVSALAGVIIGALLVWLLLPSVANQMPNGGTTTNNISSSNKEENGISQNVTAITTDITEAVEKVSEAVVGITNIQQAANNFWMQQSGPQEVGSGSGVVYKIDNNKAYIVTNHHVVEGANQLEVTLADGSKEEAQLVGCDV